MLLKTNSHFILFFVAPLNISQPLTDINVLLGQSGTLSLTCDAFPAPKITWLVHYLRINIDYSYPLNLIRFFNDTELKNSSKYKIESKQNVFSLTVNKCDHPDVGAYRALVDNGIDHTEQTAQLKVGGILFHYSSLLDFMRFVF